MQAYLQIVRLRLITSLTYRFDVYAGLASNLIMMLATVFLWQAAYQGIDSSAGVTEAQMTTYAIMSIILGSAFVANTQNVINHRIREGDIAIDFVRPINPVGSWLADDVGAAVSSLALHILPLLVFAMLFFKFPIPAGFTSFLLFIPSSILSFGILWFIGALSGLVSFWTMEVGHLGIVKDAIVRILSGSLVPLWFFPVWAQKISAFLPFQYTYQMPLSIYIGKTSHMQALRVMSIQAFWLLLLCGLTMWVWHMGRKRVMVQGG